MGHDGRDPSVVTHQIFKLLEGIDAMRPHDFQDIVISGDVRKVVLRLAAEIKVAESIQALRLAQYRADGFVLGLETAKGYSNQLIEELYVGFERAVADRLFELSDSEGDI